MAALAAHCDLTQPQKNKPDRTIHILADQIARIGLQRSLNVKTSIDHSKKTQSVYSLPLSWPSVVVQPATRAARKLAARYGLSLAHASTIANLAGLGVNEEAR